MTDDFLLDQTQREQRDRTRRRRESRSRRRGAYFVGGLTVLGLLVLGGPSIISHSSMGTSMLAKGLADYQLDGQAESIRIGWITPLQVRGLTIRGTVGGSELSVDQIDASFTVMDLLSDSSLSNLGDVSLRGVTATGSVDQGNSSFERDLAVLIEGPSTGGPATTGLIKLQEVTVSVTDGRTGATWRLSQAGGQVNLAADRTEATFAGVLTEPQGSDGAINGSFSLASNVTAGEATADQWRADVQSESLPLSVVELARRRFPEWSSSIPETISGEATGAIMLASMPDGSIEASIKELQIRELTAQDDTLFGQSGARVWKNALATLEGDVTITGNRIIGRGVRASTDFAKASMDGQFSTTFSFTGQGDNPLRWLEAIDGTGTAEIDLAMMNQALPGMIPLRSGAELVAGRALALVETQNQTAVAGQTVRRSKLTLRSDAIRARSRGVAVVIDPIELSATVASDAGSIRAEQFRWQSAFGSAVGQGDARRGRADVEIDFGRLTAMLRPIIEISETNLAGSARGEIRWDASADNVWRLSGEGNAMNLVVGLPGGQTLKRQSMRGEVEAVGRWGGQSLDELTDARLTLASAGMDVQAELVGSVAQPSSQTAMPIKIEGTGRLETIAEILAPWLPVELTRASGGVRASAFAEVSTTTNRLTQANLELTSPEFVYGDQSLAQSTIKVAFAGQGVWPAGQINARELTVESEAVSASVRGTVRGDQVDLEIKWVGKLEQLQNSVRPRIAGSNGTVRTVGYRDSAIAGEEAWSFRGDCRGDVVLRSAGGWLDVTSEFIGADLAVLQPASAGPQSQTVGPMPRGLGAGPGSTNAQTVWAEPNLKVNGKVRYQFSDGQMVAESVQVAGDWFATTLTGRLIWNETTGDVRLAGPARLKMDEVGRRLSPLAGIQIKAEGIHETPLDIQAVRGADGNVAIKVTGNLGWEGGEVAGVAFGQAAIPFELSETSVTIAPSRVPVFAAATNPSDSGAMVGNESPGAIHLAGRVHFRPGPIWMQIDRGIVADSIQLTPDMTDRWLKYLAPLAANAARIDGTISAELEEGMVVFDDPTQTRVSGRLQLGGVNMTAGPLANQLIAGVDQLRALAGSSSGPSQNRTLVTMPPQTVDFSVAGGVISHQRMYFEIDRAQIITSGRVAMDGRLNMIAQVPLDARWLGRDLQGLAGQPVSLPIDGTLSRPSLDSSGVRQVVTQLGTQAIQTQAETYLQKQLGKQMEKIGLDKIFGF